MELGKQVATRRKLLGLTQEQVADRIFVSRQSISNWKLTKLILISKACYC